MSITSWGLFLARRKAVAALVQNSRRARQSFREAADTAAFAARCRAMPDGPVPRMFLEAHAHSADLVDAMSGDATEGVRVSAARELLTRTLAGGRNREVLAARRGLPLLATVGATAPFVGLFGTVWGIVKSFASIGAAKSADLAVVAPGISEALVATAAGLVAAIPAVWFFNALTAQARTLGSELDHFAIDVLNAYDRSVASGGRAERVARGGAGR
jgi:biopolymer transport protein TolQ